MKTLYENYRSWIKIILSVLVLVFFILAVYDVYLQRVELAILFGEGALVRWLVMLGCTGLYLLCLGLTLAFIWSTERATYILAQIVRFLHQSTILRWVVMILAGILPAYLLTFTFLGEVFETPYLRLVLMLISSMCLALALSTREMNLPNYSTLLLGLVLTGSLIAIATQFSTVTNYPFALHWSEGNRLYDYSLPFGSERYNYSGKITNPYSSIGRYALWGIPYLIPNTPIWLHRLWNAVLTTIPFILFGFLLARWTYFDKVGKWAFALWVYLFLVQGPIYTPLILSAILLALLVQPNKWWLSWIGAFIAGYYASISRWTWMPAAGTWAVMILLDGFKMSKPFKLDQVFKRLLPIALVGITGYLGGILGNPKLFSPSELSQSTTFSQPLLWYRLLPNPTYKEGILLGLALATLPVAILLIWMALSHKKPLNWVQSSAYLLASLAFLAIGLTASVKIGGGNNLHNLDMFLITLALLCGLFLKEAGASLFAGWRTWAQALLALAIFIPAWTPIQHAQPLSLPSGEETQKALDIIRKKVSLYRTIGEVLFIDQRQLLTFGLVENIPFVPEYEKKYMMDQAMAGNLAYFEKFYQDLVNKRFALIISDPLFPKRKYTDMFSEEHNAWVKWVVWPLLCYYAPVNTLKEVNVQLLVPKERPSNCPKGLQNPSPNPE